MPQEWKALFCGHTTKNRYKSNHESHAENGNRRIMIANDFHMFFHFPGQDTHAITNINFEQTESRCWTADAL